MIGYACKYTPLELIRAFGGEPVPLGDTAESFAVAESLSHSNLCSFAKALIENCSRSGLKELILVNCCDSMRRAYDVLKSGGSFDFAFLMDLPDCDDACAQTLLQSELRRFCDEYGAHKGTAFDRDAFAGAFEESAAFPEGRFVAVAGARMYDSLVDELSARLPYPVYDLTCRGLRQVASWPGADDAVVAVGFDVERYAAALLAQMPCMRMDQPRQLTEYLSLPQLAGIVYHTVSFCDFYAFEYTALRKQTSLPLLKLESDYISRGLGQISTRIDAFAESLSGRVADAAGADRAADAASFDKTGTDVALAAAEADRITAVGITDRFGDDGDRDGGFVVGIDSGSTTTKIVVLDRAKRIRAHAIIRTGSKALAGAEKAMDIVLKELGVMHDAFACVVATGYGRGSIPFANETVTEISCHAKGARFFQPDTEAVIDIGGQDSKIIRLDRDGNVAGFAMNDKCAAGTGRFLEMMARTLELDLDDMGERGLRWKRDLTISSVCTVFAESEVISLIADNQAEADIIHGLNKAVAVKTASLAKRAGDSRSYTMTGGVARNSGVVAELKQKLNAKVTVLDEPDLCGAVGAALYAHEKAYG